MLTEPILMLETEPGPLAATLPEALARLCDSSLIGFDGLAAHQRHGWYLFLCQTAALALVRSGEAEAVADDSAWRDLADAAAWHRRLASLTAALGVRAGHVADDARVFRQPQLRHRADE
jgi:CRISPR system Cascade subunit CasA